MNSVILEDESLRDGLQAEKKILSLDEKVTLARLLIEAGVRRLQVGSFVHPKILPQMADTDELIKIVMNDHPGILVTALVLNEKGLERALKCNLTHLSMSASASNTHSLKNVRRSAQESLNEMTALIRETVASGVRVRAGIQCAFGCAYEGAVQEDTVLAMARVFAEAGAKELNLADTTGMANPWQVKELIGRVQGCVPDMAISLHLHDTQGLGLVNMMAGYESGVRIFDVAAGGLGGCPFVVGASGNIPTEDASNLFKQLGVDTGINLDAFCVVVDRYETLLGRPLPGRMNRLIKFRKKCLS